MNEWNENKHPRDKFGKFTDGNGKTFRQNTSYGEILASDRQAELNKTRGIKLSRQEYSVLRSIAIRKNAAQKGKVIPIGSAFTSNYFYIYSTKGDDDFTPLKKFDIELDREAIDKFLKEYGD